MRNRGAYVNGLKVLDLCLNSHKSIAFSRIDGLYHCTTASGGMTAPDLETLFRDLGHRTADANQYQANQEHVSAALKNENAAALYVELSDTIPAPAPDVLVQQDLADPYYAEHRSRPLP